MVGRQGVRAALHLDEVIPLACSLPPPSSRHSRYHFGGDRDFNSHRAIELAAGRTLCRKDEEGQGVPRKPRLMSAPAQLILVRHGETTSNVAHLLQGTTDSPLTAHGATQVKLLGVAMAAASPAPTHIFCSPAGRTRSTAQAIVNALAESGRADIELHPRPNLIEKGFGAKECTRRGVHQTGFPKGSGSAESDIAFEARVRAEGEWLLRFAGLWEVPSTGTSESDVAGPSVPRRSASPLASTSEVHRRRSASPPAAASTSASAVPLPRCIVVVTHGLWISSFFHLFLPSTSAPFAHNTGRFTIIASPVLPAAHTSMARKGRIRLKLDVANDVSHLVGLRKQAVSRGAVDQKQRKLTDLWGGGGSGQRK